MSNPEFTYHHRQYRKYAHGTYLELQGPWHTYCGGKALCADGKVRKLKRIAYGADTFFSIPASVTVQGKTVAGYVTVTTIEGWDTATKEDPAVVRFHAYKYRKNHGLLEEE